MSTSDGFQIAVIGMGCTFPSASSAPEYWQNIINKVNAITEVPKDRWDPELFYSSDPKAPDKTYSKIGGFIRGFTLDRRQFRLPPSIVEAMDLAHQIVLTAAAEAIKDAGYYGDRELPRERCAVIIGASLAGDKREDTGMRIMYPLFAQSLKDTAAFSELSLELQDRILSATEADIKESTPRITEDTMPGEIPNVMAGRIANVFDLRGPNYTIDAACASSLAAFKSACEGLKAKEFDVAVAGGSDCSMGPAAYVKFCKIGALSPNISAPFDSRANGFVMGEGAGVLIFKRLEDALQDRDRIYCVIRGFGSSSDGRGKGITAPNPRGQRLAIERAYEQCGIDPKTVDLVEAHGTSTRVGDPLEVQVLKDVMGGPTRSRPLAIGSVKSMIGHLKSAAGAASLIKTALALHHKILPPSLNCETPNPELYLEEAGIKVQREAEPWHDRPGMPRRAGISAFGFGGTNFHVILEAHQPELAKRKSQSVKRTSRMDTLLEGKTAFIFPGQGSQYAGMLGDLLEGHTEVAETFAEADLAMGDAFERPLSDFILGKVASSGTGQITPEEALRQTAITQPAVLTADVALYRVLNAHGIRPDTVAGHSLGEYAACVAAGVFTLSDALRIVAVRGREMNKVALKEGDPGCMAAIVAHRDQVEKVLSSVASYVTVANLNSPRQTIIAGSTAGVEEAMGIFKAQGISAVGLPVSHAFHSRMVAPASIPLAKYLRRISPRPPRIPVLSNVSADYYPAGPESAEVIIDLLSRQVASPVRFIEIIERMYADGVRNFIEVGPKRILSSLVREILKGSPHSVLYSNYPRAGGPKSISNLLEAMAQTPQRTAHVQATATLVSKPEKSALASPLVITGLSLGLPGPGKVFDDNHFQAMMRGESFIEALPKSVQDAILAKNIVRVMKRDKGEPQLLPVEHRDEVIQLAARMGELNLTEDYAIDAQIDEVLDVTSRLAIAAGLEALRSAGLPLIEKQLSNKFGRALSQGWRLPENVGRETGVIFASAFPGYNRLLEEVEKQKAGDDSPLSRTLLLEILSLGHAQFAQIVGALGPNTQVNSACSSTSVALAIATDWINIGRCRRVLVLGADNATSDLLFPWIGGGFLATGAATCEREISKAALPFDRRRHGMIVGMGALGLVVEKAEAAEERGVTPIAEILATRLANSAGHAMRLDPQHIAREVALMMDEVQERHGLSREEIAGQLMFMSHETYTPARGGSAQAEVEALRKTFGDQAQEIIIANTKGFTGHPQGAGIEEAVALMALAHQEIPPVPNFKEPDPDLGPLRLSEGKAYPVTYALRLSAGFGSQVAIALYKRLSGLEGRMDEKKLLNWLWKSQGSEWELFTANRVLRARKSTEVQQRQAADFSQAEARPVKTDELGQSEKSAGGEQAWGMENAHGENSDGGLFSEALEATTPTSPEVASKVVSLLCEQTGYDPEEIDLDFELEADLGIDTVKQAELIASVREHYALPRDDSFQIADFPTLKELVSYIIKRLERRAASNAPLQGSLSSEENPMPSSDDAPVSPPALPPITEPVESAWPSPDSLFTADTDEVPPGHFDNAQDKSITIKVGDDRFDISQVALTAAPRPPEQGLLKEGALLLLSPDPLRTLEMVEAIRPLVSTVVPLEFSTLSALEELEEALLEKLRQLKSPPAGVLNLLGLESGNAALSHHYARVLFHLGRALSRYYGKPPEDLFFITATGFGGRLALEKPPLQPTFVGAAQAGLTKSLSREWPACRVRVVDLNPQMPPAEMARELIAEARIVTSEVEVGLDEGERFIATLIPELQNNPLQDLGHAPVIFTGGGGEITSAVALELAKALNCPVALLDQVALPEERIDLIQAKQSIKERLARVTLPTPAEVEHELAPLRRAQEVADRVTALEEAGIEVAYLQCDLTQFNEVQSAIAAIRSRFGAIGGVVHGAGIERSKPLLEKQPGEFDLVFQVKTMGVENLWNALAGKPPNFFVVFSSVAGRLGNQGQADYSAANDAMARFMPYIAHQAPGMNALAIDWTGWDEIGMAVRSGMRALLLQRGVELLPARVGVEIAVKLIMKGVRGEVVVAGSMGEMSDRGERIMESPPMPEKAEIPKDRESPIPADEAAQAANLTISETGKRALLILDLDPKTQVFLKDHVLDGTPLLPGVVGMEFMARAVDALSGGLPVIEIKDTHFLRPAKVHPSRPMRIEIEALAQPGTSSVYDVTLKSHSRASTGRILEMEHFKASFCCEETGTPLRNLSLDAMQYAGPEQDKIYRWFFHGPSFHVLRRCPRWGNNALVARGIIPKEEISTEWEEERSLIGPRTMEIAFQAAGLWIMLKYGRRTLPAGFSHCQIEGRLAPAAESVARVVCRRIDDGERYTLDVEVLDDAGALVLRLNDLLMVDYGPLKDAEADEHPDEYFDRVDIRLDLLRERTSLIRAAEAELGPEELKYYQDIRNPKRRIEFLGGRLAAKRAIIAQILELFGVAIAPSDIQVLAEEGSPPSVRIDGHPELTGSPPWITISHSGNRAVAIATPANSNIFVGVDVERIEKRSDSFLAYCFTDKERETIAQYRRSEDAEELATAFWSMKESITKALGVGMTIDPQEVELSPTLDKGNFQVCLTGKALITLDKLGGQSVETGYTREGAQVLAWAFIEGPQGPTEEGPSEKKKIDDLAVISNLTRKRR